MHEHDAFTYEVPGDDFTRAGEASGDVKRTLKKLGFPSDAVRRVAIAMYEGEINMVIHAGGGEADVDILPDKVTWCSPITARASPTWNRPCRRGGPPPRTTSARWASARAWACPT